jgi:hypothetical protein
MGNGSPDYRRHIVASLPSHRKYIYSFNPSIIQIHSLHIFVYCIPDHIMFHWTIGPLQYHKNSRLLSPRLSPTLYTASKYAQANVLVASVNDFFLTHWPFKVDAQRKRFVDEGYALMAPRYKTPREKGYEEREGWNRRSGSVCWIVWNIAGYL